MIIDQEARERWVIPFYMKVLHAQQPLAVTELLIEASNAISQETVDALLADFNWRTRKMAAIYAGVNAWSGFTDAIGGHLLKSEVCFAGASYCFALARFGSDDAVFYLKQYLDIWLRRPECWYDQSHALAALLWLDRIRGTDDAAAYLANGGIWECFVQNKPHWDLQRTRLTFFETMKFCQEQFPQ